MVEDNKILISLVASFTALFLAILNFFVSVSLIKKKIKIENKNNSIKKQIELLDLMISASQSLRERFLLITQKSSIDSTLSDEMKGIIVIRNKIIDAFDNYLPYIKVKSKHYEETHDLKNLVIDTVTNVNKILFKYDTLEKIKMDEIKLINTFRVHVIDLIEIIKGHRELLEKKIK